MTESSVSEEVKISFELEEIKKLICNKDQAQIANLGLSVVKTLLQKNHDYGSSVFEPPVLAPSMNPGDCILIRLSDKYKRFLQLQKQEAKVESESILDTVKDSIGYWILYLVQKEKELIAKVQNSES